MKDPFKITRTKLTDLEIVESTQKVPTTGVEHTRQLLRILQQRPEITLNELVDLLGCVPKVTILKRLSLHKIVMGTGIMADVESGKICLSNAYCLAKLSPDYQYEYWRRAKEMRASEFVKLIKQEIRHG